MNQRITYYYALASGFAYLGEAELQRIAAEAGAPIAYCPVDILRVFAASETTPPPRQSPVRRAYRDIELARWAKRRNLPITVQPRFWPVAVAGASHAVLAAQGLGVDPGALSLAFLQAVWVEERDIADVATIAAIVAEAAPAGRAEEIIARAAEPAIARAFDRITDEAIAAGVFGSPSYVLDGEMFFGQDRLNLVAERLGVAA